MPNVLILPRSADYSEEVWMEIRAKAVTILRSFLLDGVIPSSAVSDEEDDDRDYSWQEERQDKQAEDMLVWSSDVKLLGEPPSGQDLRHKQMYFNTPDPRPQDGGVSQALMQCDNRSHGKAGGKKGKKRPGRRKSQQRSADSLAAERDTNWVALQRDDRVASIMGRDQVLSSSSRFASPEDSKLKRGDYPLAEEAMLERRSSLSFNKGQAIDSLKEGYVVALRAENGAGYHVARQRGPGRGWCLDKMSNVTTRDPAAQFLVVLKNKVIAFVHQMKRRNVIPIFLHLDFKPRIKSVSFLCRRGLVYDLWPLAENSYK